MPIPKVGEKQWAEREKKERSQWKQWPTMLATATIGGARNPPGPIKGTLKNGTAIIVDYIQGLQEKQ